MDTWLWLTFYYAAYLLIGIWLNHALHPTHNDEDKAEWILAILLWPVVLVVFAIRVLFILRAILKKRTRNKMFAVMMLISLVVLYLMIGTFTAILLDPKRIPDGALAELKYVVAWPQHVLDWVADIR